MTAPHQPPKMVTNVYTKEFSIYQLCRVLFLTTNYFMQNVENFHYKFTITYRFLTIVLHTWYQQHSQELFPLSQILKINTMFQEHLCPSSGETSPEELILQILLFNLLRFRATEPGCHCTEVINIFTGNSDSSIISKYNGFWEHV